jgi:raffinose/stachyose/melibiose transport system permease protein
VVPVAYIVINGFRTTKQINESLAGWPDPWTFANYGRVLFGEDTLFWNQAATSSIIALGTTAGVVVFGVMAAFVIARYEFKARNAMYALFTAGLLFPISVAILPLSIMLRTLGLNGSPMGVIIPQIAFALPTTVIILVPFLRAIPKELEEAAMIDGTSRIGFFWRILLPLSGPGLVTVGVLAFVNSWNGYLLPLFVLGAGGAGQSNYTLPLGVQQFSTQYSADTAGVLAFTSLAMIPALLFFTLAERRIVGGLTGAVKG